MSNEVEQQFIAAAPAKTPRPAARGNAKRKQPQRSEVVARPRGGYSEHDLRIHARLEREYAERVGAAGQVRAALERRAAKVAKSEGRR